MSQTNRAREETLLAALASLDNFVLSAPLSSAWGDGTTSSSDGMRMHVGVQAANAEYNAKYFHARRGTNMYIHAADIWVPFGKPQINGWPSASPSLLTSLLNSYRTDTYVAAQYHRLIILKIREAALAKGISQGKLSRKADVDVKTIRRIFRNPAEIITTETLDKIATALEVNVCELIEQIPNSTKEQHD